MSTALQITNRVMRLLRNEDVVAFTSPTGLTEAVLDRVNDAMLTVLNDRVWDFQIRRDGVLLTQALISTTATVNRDTVSVQVATTTAILDPAITHIVVRGSDDQGSTAYRAISYNPGLFVYTIDAAFQGDNVINAEADVYANEYVLPDTVKSLLSMRYQEQELQLVFVDKDFGFDQHFPAPHLDPGDTPEIAMVGGYGSATYDNTILGLPVSDGLVVRIFPVPTVDQKIDYSYIHSPARFTDPADEYTWIPEKVIDLIVDLAYARAQQVGIGNEPQAGIALEARVQASIKTAWMSHKPNAGQRRILGSLDSKGGPNPLYAGLPRVVGTIPNG